MSRTLIRKLSRLGSSSGSPTARATQTESPAPAPAAAAQSPPRKDVWLDCDPGHDDAIALLLALHDPRLRLVGVSTVSGNASGAATFLNAARLLEMFHAGHESDGGADAYLDKVPLYRGADEPLIKAPRADKEIHGEDGLGGVTGLPSSSSLGVQKRLQNSSATGENVGGYLQYFSGLLSSRIASGQPRINLVATGPLTNVALLIKVYPQLVKDGVEQIVIMGGAAGVRGNRGPMAEFNILCDPEAARIVFEFPIKVVMAGLNVTHQAIFTPALHDRLLNHLTRNEDAQDSPPLSALRKMVSSTLTFFASTYASEFGFSSGPPVHDVLAVAYVAAPELFHSSKDLSPRRYNVEVECSDGSSALGATIVDFWADRVDRQVILGKNIEDEHRVGQTWGRGGFNVLVLEHVDVDGLWNTVFDAVDRAEAHIATCEVRI